MKKFHYGEITEKIIYAFYKVYNELGYGFLEKVYENALQAELISSNFSVQSQRPISVYYNNIIVGEFFADIIVDNQIILEIKTAETISDAHNAQLVNYLKATGIEVGLVLNFGPKPGVARRVYQLAKKNQKGSAKILKIQKSAFH